MKEEEEEELKKLKEMKEFKEQQVELVYSKYILDIRYDSPHYLRPLSGEQRGLRVRVRVGER